MAEEDYSKYSNDELMKMYEHAMREAQTYHVSQLVKKAVSLMLVLQLLQTLLLMQKSQISSVAKKSLFSK